MEICQKSLLEKYDRFMLLNLKINSSDENLIHKYWLAAEAHNTKMMNDIQYIDAGFDVYVPKSEIISFPDTFKIDFQIQCSAQIITDQKKQFNIGFYLYPRSSLSKTKLRMSNSVGIVDAGYRGNLLGAFDPISDCIIDGYTRLVQICAPGLIPILVNIVDNLDNTVRGNNGFGSSGR
jgi:dUTP pyrophosphatase